MTDPMARLSPSAIPEQRFDALNAWLRKTLNQASLILVPIAGDASFRQYFRVYQGGQSYIVMNAPPDKELTAPFVQIATRLIQEGIHAPTVYAQNDQDGFLLLEDLGDQLLLNQLTLENVDGLYRQAMGMLARMQTVSLEGLDLSPFNQTLMLDELALFQEWFLGAYLNRPLNPKESRMIQHTFERLTQAIETQPVCFMHRDFHSRNLMFMGSASFFELGVFDFQDAVLGPIAYDLVSLLKDCYVQWPRKQVLEWARYFYKHYLFRYHAFLSESGWIRAFDWCGLQRHLKVLGIFCRLHLRDGKSGYLKDLPRTLHYVLECLSTQTEFQEFYEFMNHQILPVTPRC